MIRGNEAKYLRKALKSTWISGGYYVDEFETQLSKRFQFPYVTTTSNGTSAIHAAFLAANLRPGDEVLVPGFAFQAAANVAIQLNLVPKFIDVDSKTWCLDVQSAQNSINKRTKCIVAVHTYGNMCEMDKLTHLAEGNGITLIEDAAEALGSSYKGTHAGNFGRFATLSFQATKTISTGEGGAVVSRSAEDLLKLKLLRNHGMGEEKYFHQIPGNNFRLTNLQAALGCAQLEYIDVILTKKRAVHDFYKKNIPENQHLRFQKIDENVKAEIWATGLWINWNKFKTSKQKIFQEMAQLGIETRPGFHPASNMDFYKAGFLPNSEKIHEGLIVLPSWPDLTKLQLKYICNSLLRCLGI